MKKIIIAFLFFCSIGYSQTYKIVYCIHGSNDYPFNGAIIINDKKVIIESENNPKEEYELVKKVDGYKTIIYITDGVMTHFLTLVNYKGTIKGLDYDTLISFHFDERRSEKELIYSCILQK